MRSVARRNAHRSRCSPLCCVLVARSFVLLPVVRERAMVSQLEERALFINPCVVAHHKKSTRALTQTTEQQQTEISRETNATHTPAPPRQQFSSAEIGLGFRRFGAVEDFRSFAGSFVTSSAESKRRTPTAHEGGRTGSAAPPSAGQEQGTS